MQCSDGDVSAMTDSGVGSVDSGGVRVVDDVCGNW